MMKTVMLYRRSIQVLVPLMLAACLCSCFPRLLPGDAPTLVRLNPAMPGNMSGGQPKQQITVGIPQLAQDIDNDRITVILKGREVRQLSGARWSAGLGSVVNDCIVRALESTQAFAGVSGEVDGLVSQRRLNSEIRLFALEYASETDSPTARFSAVFRLLDARQAKIVATRQVDVSVPAAGTDTTALVSALEQALEKGLAEMSAWVVANINRK